MVHRGERGDAPVSPQTCPQSAAPCLPAKPPTTTCRCTILHPASFPDARHTYNLQSLHTGCRFTCTFTSTGHSGTLWPIWAKMENAEPPAFSFLTLSNSLHQTPLFYSSFYLYTFLRGGWEWGVISEVLVSVKDMIMTLIFYSIISKRNLQKEKKKKKLRCFTK